MPNWKDNLRRYLEMFKNITPDKFILTTTIIIKKDGDTIASFHGDSNILGQINSNFAKSITTKYYTDIRSKRREKIITLEV